MNKKYFKNSHGFTIIELVVVMAVFMFIIGAAIGIFISIIQAQKKVLAEQQLLNQVSYVEEYMSKALRMAKKDTSAGPATACLVDNSSTSPNTGAHQNYNYLLTRPDPVSGFFTGIKFINSSDNAVCDEFYLDTTTNVLKEIKSLNSSSDDNVEHAVPLTSSSMKINYVRFGIDGTDGESNNTSIPTGDQDTVNGVDFSYFQPRVTIVMSIGIPDESQGAGRTCIVDTDCFPGQVCDLSDYKCLPTRTIQTTISQRNLNTR